MGVFLEDEGAALFLVAAFVIGHPVVLKTCIHRMLAMHPGDGIVCQDGGSRNDERDRNSQIRVNTRKPPNDLTGLLLILLTTAPTDNGAHTSAITLVCAR